MQPLQGDFLELADLLEGNNVVQEVLVQQNLHELLPEEQNLMALHDAEMQVPLLPALPIDVLDEEIPKDQLLEFDDNGLPLDLMDDQNAEQGEQGLNNDDEHDGQNGLPVGDNILNVGMVLIRQVGPDPTLVMWERAKGAEATRLWAKFFSPGMPNSTLVSVSSEWANFFTIMLMSPDKFAWAKDFLSSRAINCLEGKNGLIDYSIPAKCPSDKPLPCCSSSLASEPIPDSAEKETLTVESTPAVTVKGKGKRTPLVVTEVGRSLRLQSTYSESKPSRYSDKRCIACFPSPPTLSPKLIKNLGVQLCEMDPELLEEEVLKKERKTQPIVKRRKKSSHKIEESSREKEDDQGGPNGGRTEVQDADQQDKEYC
jgi:hypothetical protein